MASKVPNGLESIKPYYLLSKQFEKRDEVVSYYAKLYVVQEGLSIAKRDAASKNFIHAEMTLLEQLKKKLSDREDTAEEISNKVVGQAHVENVALQLFDSADSKDRQSIFNKAMMKAFLASSYMFAILKQFGELTDEVEEKMKYAKWKAVEINKCLEAGVTPTPGPPGGGAIDDGFNSTPGPSDKPVPKPRHNIPPNNEFPSSESSGHPPDSYSGYPPGPPSSGYPPGPPTSTYPPGPPSSGYPPGPSYPPEPPSSSYPPGPPNSDYIPEPPEESPGQSVHVDAEAVTKAQKQCRFAISSLDYDDVPGAIDFLEKALALLKH